MYPPLNDIFSAILGNGTRPYRWQQRFHDEFG